MKKLLLIVLMFVGLTGFKSVDSRTITGWVIAKDDGLLLPGATIKIAGSNIVTQTNSNGKFSINVPKGYYTLVFSFNGYKNQLIVIGKSNTINVVLEPKPIECVEPVIR
jgi:hypothetical protein